MTRSTATITAVLGAAIGVVLALRKQQSTEETTRIAVERHELDAIRHELDVIAALRERYTTAAEQLGDDSPAVRLAGVYAMAALADDWTVRDDHDETQTCIDVLCAYLRTRRAYVDETARFADQEVRQTIVRAITAHLQPDATKNWHGRNLDLTNAVLDFPVSFDGAMFSGRETSFAKAMFSGGRTSFAKATFSGGRTSFVRATFSGCYVGFRGIELAESSEATGPILAFESAVAEGAVLSFHGLKLVEAARLDFGGLVLEGAKAAVIGPWQTRRPGARWPERSA